MNSMKRLVLDVVAFVALLIASNPALTGLAVHEWLSISIIVPLLLHLVINWDWTVRVATTFFDRLLHVSRLNLIVDGLLFVSSVAVMVSGFAVSQVALRLIGITTQPTAVWTALHSASADATIALLLTHFVLHGRWLARAIIRWFSAEDAPAPVRS